MRWASPIDSSNTLKLLKNKFSTAKSSHELFDLDWIYLVDSGGQPQFVDILPLLFGSEALYLMVVRLDQDLDDKQDNCFCSRGESYKLPEKLTLTHYQMIERACQIAEAQCTQSSPKQVVVIATHYDQTPNPEDKVRIFNERLLKLHKEYEDVLVPSDISNGKIIFPVNAMSTSDERKVYTRQLQECVIDIVRRSIQPVEVPLKWFVYELDLDEESQLTCGVVKKSRCIEIGKRLEMNESEIESSLRFFNKLALHLYHPEYDNYPDLVLIKMDPLTDRLSALIRKSFHHTKHMPTSQCSRLKNCGLFSKSFLNVAFENISDKQITFEEFLQICQCLKVIVSVKNDEYFIPSALSVDAIKHNTSEFVHVPVVFNWKQYLLPPGFFFTLIVTLLQLQDDDDGENHFSLHEFQTRDRITLAVEVYGGILTLTNEHKWIWLHYKGRNSLDYVNIICLVVQAMNDVVNQFSKMAGISFPYICFPCPCGQDLHPCRLNKRHDYCICIIDRSFMTPVSYEMYNIMQAVENVVGKHYYNSF